MAGTPPPAGSPANPAPPAPAGQPPAAQPPAAPAPAAPPPKTDPPAPPAPAAQPPAAPPPKADPPPDDKAPAWLPERLKSAQKAVLSRHGVESEEQLKAKLDRLKELEDEKLTDQQKLEAKATRAGELEKQLAGYAAAQMAALTEEQRAGVTKVAGDDPGRQLDTIEAMRPTWAKAAAGGAAGQQAGQQPAGQQPPARQPVAPATTTHGGGSPPTGTAPPEDPAAHYEWLLQYNPIRASAYFGQNEAAIAQARKARQQ